MDKTALFSLALGLTPPWAVASIDFDASAQQVDIWIDFVPGSRFGCPICSEQECGVHDTVAKQWRHLDFFQHHAILHARVLRVRCPTCGVHQIPIPWARASSGFTLLFEAMIMELTTHMPVAVVARLVGATDKRLWRIVEHYVDDAVERIDCSEIQRVGVDETSAKRRHDYITVFYDLDARRLVYVANGKDAGTIEDFEQFMWDHDGNAGNIREVACDMSPAFIKGIAEHMDRAEITFDRFHVSKLLTDAVEKVRRQETKHNPALKGSRYLWITNPANLEQWQLIELEALTKNHGQLAEAYRLKESLRDLYEQGSFADAEGYLRAWLADAYASGIKPIIRAASTIQKHAAGILRWHLSRITTAVMEGINSLIQAAKRKARGYRNKRTLRLMAYLIAGKLDLRLPT
jgi:transposase